MTSRGQRSGDLACVLLGNNRDNDLLSSSCRAHRVRRLLPSLLRPRYRGVVATREVRLTLSR